MIDNDQEAYESELAEAEARARRLQLIADHWEIGPAEMPDATTPGAACVKVTRWKDKTIVRRHPRYALLTQYGDKGNHRLYLADDVAGVERLAAQAVTDAYGGELVVCYYDLTELAGPEPRPSEGDVVRFTDEGKMYGSFGKPTDGNFYVISSETDTFDGVAYEKLCLSRDPDASWDDWDHKVDETYVEIVEPGHPDERLPVRYDLARVVTTVVFNTVATPQP